jgi:hypothetical protein
MSDYDMRVVARHSVCMTLLPRSYCTRHEDARGRQSINAEQIPTTLRKEICKIHNNLHVMRLNLTSDNANVIASQHFYNERSRASVVHPAISVVRDRQNDRSFVFLIMKPVLHGSFVSRWTLLRRE